MSERYYGRDPFAGYDAWLEAPIQRMYAEAEEELEAWEEFCAEKNGPEVSEVETIVGPRPAPPRTPVVPVEACEDDHPDHNIYVAWLALHNAINARWDRLADEEQAEFYRQEQIDMIIEEGKQGGW